MKGIIIRVLFGVCMTWMLLVTGASWYEGRQYKQYIESETQVQRACLLVAEKADANSELVAYSVCAGLMPAFQVQLIKPVINHLAGRYDLSEETKSKILSLYAERVYRDIP
jgi:hypothetical protein